MGLDWLPGPKPRNGREAEYLALKEALSRWFCWGRKSKEARLEQLTVEPWETLEAPLVGKDERANEWARQNSESRKNRQLDMAGWLKQLEGLPVVELAGPSDGLPLYSNGGPGQYVGAESFRAQFLKDCAEIIGEETFNEAFVEMAPDECVAFGNMLEKKARAFAEIRSIDLSKVDECEDDGADEFRLGVVLAASRWCIFWGNKGQGMVPWF